MKQITDYLLSFKKFFRNYFTESFEVNDDDRSTLEPMHKNH